MNELEYRPINIEFKVANSTGVPENLGLFETADEALKYMQDNFAYFTRPLTAARLMDEKEKHELRSRACDLLEYDIPNLEQELDRAIEHERKAKEAVKNAKEALNSVVNTAKAYGKETKRGIKEIDLDEDYTYRIACDGQFLFYTYIDKQLKLAKVCDISEAERGELYSASEKNEARFRQIAGDE